MIKLKPGVQRGLGRTTEDAERLNGPIPYGGYKNALFLSCCESNAVPLLLQRKYWRCNHMVQNPGNLVPPSGTPGAVGAEIERAYEAGVRDFVVCGHHPCTVVQALVAPEASPPSGPSMAAWLAQAAETTRVVAASYAGLDPQARLEAAAQVHVLAQLQNLLTYPALAAGVEDGTVALHGWVANTALGQLLHYDPAEGQFMPWLRTVMKVSSR
ncbi:MAG: Carbonic anhydrase [Cyanobacteria bacterium RYN_339]|nr:Carbonic anhydrase [Cyanobacteria bacterium RYN_339]